MYVYWILVINEGEWAIGPNPKLKRLCPDFGNLIGSTAWNSAVFLLLFEKWKLLSCVRLFATPWDYTVHGILQARILEWVAFPFSRGSSQPGDWTQVSHTAGGFFTSWATGEAQECWNGLPILSPVDLPNPGIEPGFPALQVDSLPTELWGKLIPAKPQLPDH